MAVIQNKWIEKVKKKRELETAPAFEAAPTDNWLPTADPKPIKRYTSASRGTYKHSLRGIRK